MCFLTRMRPRCTKIICTNKNKQYNSNNNLNCAFVVPQSTDTAHKTACEILLRNQLNSDRRALSCLYGDHMHVDAKHNKVQQQSSTKQLDCKTIVLASLLNARAALKRGKCIAYTIEIKTTSEDTQKKWWQHKCRVFGFASAVQISAISTTSTTTQQQKQ